MLCDVTKQMSMNIIDRHFSVMRILLEIISLWPYQTSIFARLQFICVFTLITSTLIFEVHYSIITCVFQLAVVSVM